MVIIKTIDCKVTANASVAVSGMIIDYNPTISKQYANGKDNYAREDVVLCCDPIDKVAEYIFSVATTDDFNDEQRHYTCRCDIRLNNLLPNTIYYWKVTAGDYVSSIQSFCTADTIRTLKIEGVTNTRDIGGYFGLGGKKMKYGKVYRGARLENITDLGKEQLLHRLGVQTDLDLRYPGEEGAGVASPLGEGVNYYNYSSPYYWAPDNGINDERCQEALVKIIRVFANEANYPIYVHCSAGRDRTGTICYLISALCGVEEDDLCLDYELSMLSSVSDAMDIDNFMHNLFYRFIRQDEGYLWNSYAPNGTLAEAVEAFLISIGVTKGEIDNIKKIMLS